MLAAAQRFKGIHCKSEQFSVGGGQGTEAVDELGDVESVGRILVTVLDSGEGVDDLGLGELIHGPATGDGHPDQGQRLEVAHQFAGEALRSPRQQFQLAVLAGVYHGDQVGFAHRRPAQRHAQGAVGSRGGHWLT